MQKIAEYPLLWVNYAEMTLFRDSENSVVGGDPSKTEIEKSTRSSLRCLAVYWARSNLPRGSQVQPGAQREAHLLILVKIALGT